MHQCVHTDKMENCSALEYSNGVLITVKKLSVESWTLLIINDHHLGSHQYVCRVNFAVICNLPFKKKKKNKWSNDALSFSISAQQPCVI